MGAIPGSLRFQGCLPAPGIDLLDLHSLAPSEPLLTCSAPPSYFFRQKNRQCLEDGRGVLLLLMRHSRASAACRWESRIQYALNPANIALSSSYHRHYCVLSRFSRVQLFTTPWTAAHQTPLSMGFSRQEFWDAITINPFHFTITSLRNTGTPERSTPSQTPKCPYRRRVPRPKSATLTRPQRRDLHAPSARPPRLYAARAPPLARRPRLPVPRLLPSLGKTKLRKCSGLPGQKGNRNRRGGALSHRRLTRSLRPAPSALSSQRHSRCAPHQQHPEALAGNADSRPAPRPAASETPSFIRPF